MKIITLSLLVLLSNAQLAQSTEPAKTTFTQLGISDLSQPNSVILFPDNITVQNGGIVSQIYIHPETGDISFSNTILESTKPPHAPLPQGWIAYPAQAKGAFAGQIGFAFNGQLGTLRVSGAQVLIDLDGDGKEEKLNQCLTTEGVYLYVTPATPVDENTVLWSAYRSLPYSVQSTCEKSFIMQVTDQ